MKNFDETKKVAFIALSGECDKTKVEQGKRYFEEVLKKKVILSKNIFSQNRYLAGSDEDKLKELHKFFKDSNIEAIICARGGYGGIRLVNQIDYELIKNNPKIFCGFSDVTALLLMIYKKTGQIVYHGPMISSDFSSEVSEFTKDNFLKAVNKGHLVFEGKKIYKEGSTKGIIWGGNLATIVSLCGLDFIPNKKFIFFTEDLNEPVYKIDKMFQQLLNIEKFKNNCVGIVLGEFLDVDNEEFLEDYFEELAQRLQIPVVSGFKITHSKEKVTIPIGAKAILSENLLKIIQ